MSSVVGYHYQFMFFLKYMEMLAILFKFIASRSRDCIMHLSALKDMLPVIITMNCIKYRRMLPAYLSDMLYLKKSDPTV